MSPILIYFLPAWWGHPAEARFSIFRIPHSFGRRICDYPVTLDEGAKSGVMRIPFIAAMVARTPPNYPIYNRVEFPRSCCPIQTIYLVQIFELSISPNIPLLLLELFERSILIHHGGHA